MRTRREQDSLGARVPQACRGRGFLPLPVGAWVASTPGCFTATLLALSRKAPRQVVLTLLGGLLAVTARRGLLTCHILATSDLCHHSEVKVRNGLRSYVPKVFVLPLNM